MFSKKIATFIFAGSMLFAMAGQAVADVPAVMLAQSSGASATGSYDRSAVTGNGNAGLSPTTPANSDIVPGTPSADAGKGIITCGKAGQPMCTLCDLIIGINTVIKYGLGIAVAVALTVIVVGAVMYIVSAGDTGMIEMAKSAMKNAVIGLIIVLAAWLIINYLIVNVLGATRTGWSTFTCR